MLNQLLDIIAPYGEPRRPRPIIRPQEEPVPTDSVDSLNVDSLSSAVDQVIQGGSDMAAGSMGGISSSLLWTIIAVTAALALCLYFAYQYRRRLSVKS